METRISCLPEIWWYRLAFCKVNGVGDILHRRAVITLEAEDLGSSLDDVRLLQSPLPTDRSVELV